MAMAPNQVRIVLPTGKSFIANSAAVGKDLDGTTTLNTVSAVGNLASYPLRDLLRTDEDVANVEKVKELSARVKFLDEELASTTKLLNAASEQAKHHRNEADHYQQALNVRTKERDHAREQWRAARAEADLYQKDLEPTARELSRVLEELAELRTEHRKEVERLHTDLRTSAQLMNQSANEVRLLRSQLDKAQESNKDLAEKLERSEKVKDALRAEVRVYRHEADDLEEAILFALSVLPPNHTANEVMSSARARRIRTTVRHDPTVWAQDHTSQEATNIPAPTNPPKTETSNAKAHSPDPAVHHPPHYGGKDNPYEVEKVIAAWDLGFHLGNVLKYIGRPLKAPSKAERLRDLGKAQWYLNRYVERMKEDSPATTKDAPVPAFDAENAVKLIHRRMDNLFRQTEKENLAIVRRLDIITLKMERLAKEPPI